MVVAVAPGAPCHSRVPPLISSMDLRAIHCGMHRPRLTQDCYAGAVLMVRCGPCSNFAVGWWSVRCSGFKKRCGPTLRWFCRHVIYTIHDARKEYCPNSLPAQREEARVVTDYTCTRPCQKEPLRNLIEGNRVQQKGWTPSLYCPLTQPACASIEHPRLCLTHSCECFRSTCGLADLDLSRSDSRLVAQSFVRLEKAFLWQQDAVLRLEQAILSECEYSEHLHPCPAHQLIPFQPHYRFFSNSISLTLENPHLH